MNDIWRLSATDLASKIRSRKISAKEAASAALARLDAVNPAINAVVDHRPEETLAQAEAIDTAIAKGEDTGVLAGVPITVKVNVDQAGFATTNGVRLQRDLVAQFNNPVVDNLRKAGAVIVGRTNAPAFSYRWFTTNLLHGDTKNPRDPAITPGGSSGGAAAAVTAGIGHIAHGTDIAGSIRYPAYACGVHGLRPTVGRIPAFNASLPERSIGGQITAVSGPLARTVGDLRLALAAMSQRDRATRGGCPRRWKARLCRAGQQFACVRVGWRRRRRSATRWRTRASVWNGRVGVSRKSPIFRRSRKPRNGRSSFGSPTAMMLWSMLQSGKAIPAH